MCTTSGGNPTGIDAIASLRSAAVTLIPGRSMTAVTASVPPGVSTP